MGRKLDGLDKSVRYCDVVAGASWLTAYGLGKAGVNPNLFGKTPGKPAQVQLTGQEHHAVSRKSHGATEQHPNLTGKYQARDPRFVARGKDATSHRGYQRWHRDIDAEVSDWVRRNPNATPQNFEKFLHERYSQPDLLERFPEGLGGKQ